jgi:hypothetical protein
MYGPPSWRIDIPQTEPKPRSPSARQAYSGGRIGFSRAQSSQPGFSRSAAQTGIARGADYSAPPWLCHAALIFLIVEDAGFLNIDRDEA